MSEAPVELPFGIDPDRVRDWLIDNVRGVVPPIRFSRIAGGLSNLTYLVEDGAGTVCVLRRPPHGGVLESAHDMARERRILDALADSAVPVPRVLARCQDTIVTGSEFYVMSQVPGTVLHGAESVSALPGRARVVASEDLVDTLVALHGVALSEAITGHRRAEPFAERQLRRWSRQIAPGGSNAGILKDISTALGAEVPAETRTTAVHGDYRPGNALFDRDGTVLAVLDWELWTVGDPLADLGWLLATSESDFAVGWAALPEDGFLSGDALQARYADAAECDRQALTFYRAFSMWKLALIAEGVVARYVTGAMGERPADFEEITRRPRLLAERAPRDSLRVSTSRVTGHPLLQGMPAVRG